MKLTTAYLSIAGFLLASCFASAAQADDASDAEPAATALVQTAVAELRDVPQRLEAYGSVGTAPGQQRSLAALRNVEVDSIEVVAGAAVRKDAVLMRLKTAPEAHVAYAQARSAADAARAALAQNQRLFADHMITNAQLADSQHAAADAEANLKAQEAVGGDAMETELKAPSDGVVGAIAVHAGDRVAANAVLLSFSSTDPLYAQLGISPEDAAQVRPGMAASVQSVFASGASAEGKVSQVGAGLDASSGLVEVMVRLDRAAHLVPGSAVDGEIVLAKVHGPAVPRSAVLHDDDGAYLFVVEGGKAHRVNVQTGPDDGTYIAVTHGIKVGDRIVTLGNYELDDGMAVREQPR